MEPKDKNSRVFSKEETKKLLAPFLLLFLVNFLIINWNNVSWIFNYRVISGMASNFFEKIGNKKDNANEFEEEYHLGEENILEIPKIEVSAPLVLVEDLSKKDFNNELDRGVVLFPNSALPDQVGQIIVLGHSAPTNWPEINYDKIFSRLNELKEKDEIILYFNHQKYRYYVNKKIFLEKGEEIPANLARSENSLLLVSCWPPGKNLKRIIVESTLIKT